MTRSGVQITEAEAAALIALCDRGSPILDRLADELEARGWRYEDFGWRPPTHEETRSGRRRMDWTRVNLWAARLVLVLSGLGLLVALLADETGRFMLLAVAGGLLLSWAIIVVIWNSS